MPAGQPGLPFVAGAVFTEGGLGKHSAEELQRILAGKTVSTSFGVDQDFFTFMALTNGRDLRLQLELLRAYLTDPGYRPEALDRARREFPEFFNDLRQNVEAVLDNEVARFLASGDLRFGFPTQAQAESVTLDAVRAWLAPALKDGYVEVSLVGDFDPAAAEAALAATFGTLPQRAEKRADYASALNVKFPTDAAGTSKIFTAESVIPKAVSTVYWPTVDMFDINRARRLNVLAQVFADRLRVQVREDLGEAYSPEAVNNSSDVFPKYGYTFALCMIAPNQAASLVDKMREIGAGIATGGVTKDEFDRAVIPLRKTLVEYRRNNTYWLSRVLSGSQAFPQQLEWARTLPTAYDSMTPEELAALAKEYLGADHAVRVQVLPVAPAKPAPPKP
jgi:zinc protease